MVICFYITVTYKLYHWNSNRLNLNSKTKLPAQLSLFRQCCAQLSNGRRDHISDAAVLESNWNFLSMFMLISDFVQYRQKEYSSVLTMLHSPDRRLLINMRLGFALTLEVGFSKYARPKANFLLSIVIVEKDLGLYWKRIKGICFCFSNNKIWQACSNSILFS